MKCHYQYAKLWWPGVQVMGVPLSVSCGREVMGCHGRMVVAYHVWWFATYGVSLSVRLGVTLSKMCLPAGVYVIGCHCR